MKELRKLFMDSDSDTTTIIVIAVLSTVGVVAAVIICYCWYKCMWKKNKGDIESNRNDEVDKNE